MPLVALTPSGAITICAQCGTERTVPMGHWKKITDDTGKAVSHSFSTTSCPACATRGVDTVETFIYHDDVVVKIRDQEAEFVTKAVDEEGKPLLDEDGKQVVHRRLDIVKVIAVDPTDIAAQQQALVREMGKRLGCTPALFNQPRDGFLYVYDTPPSVPEPNAVRNDLARRMMRQGRFVFPKALP